MNRCGSDTALSSKQFMWTMYVRILHMPPTFMGGSIDNMVTSSWNKRNGIPVVRKDRSCQGRNNGGGPPDYPFHHRWFICTVFPNCKFVRLGCGLMWGHPSPHHHFGVILISLEPFDVKRGFSPVQFDNLRYLCSDPHLTFDIIPYFAISTAI